MGRYLAHFAGPMPLLAPLMIPIELISHLARPLSLTIRLFANMFAGEKVTLTFLSSLILLCRRSSWDCTSLSHSCRLIFLRCSP